MCYQHRPRHYRFAVLGPILAATLISQSAAASAQRPGPLPPQTIARIDSLAKAQLAVDGVGGMTIGLVTESGLIWTKSYGYADMARHTPASRETVYRIGSITRQFIAFMLEQLVRRGAVRMSDAADRYLPALDSIPGAKGVWVESPSFSSRR